jgi:hypothetical protein
VNQLLIWTYTNQTTSWLVHSWSTFSAQTSHMYTRTHKTHHGPNLVETTTFPLIIFFVINHGGCIQMSFFLDSQVGSPEISKIGTLATLEAHNFLFKPLIEVRCKAKLWPLLRVFQNTWHATYTHVIQGDS